MKRISAGLLSAGLVMLGIGQVSAAPEQAGNVAAIHVLLPADATLTIDGQPTKSTSADRLFVTPPLTPGKTFHYDLTAKFVRDGKNVSVQQSVAVRAGHETDVSLFGAHQASDADYMYGTATPDTQSFYYEPEYHYTPSGDMVAGYRLTGRRRIVGGFHPLRWGSPSSPYTAGNW